MTTTDYWRDYGRVKMTELVEQLRPEDALEVLRYLVDSNVAGPLVPARLVGLTTGIVQRREDEGKKGRG